MEIYVSRYYEIITPESAEYGDAAERGEVYTDQRMTVKELIREIRDSGIDQPSDSHINSGTWLNSADPDRDYRTGAERYESLHFHKIDRHTRRTDLSAWQLRRLFKAARIKVR